MIPGSFDPATARTFVGDAQARALEQSARQDADAGAYAPPPISGETYASQVAAQMCAIVYREQYTRRLARNARKAQEAA